jgi:hypothetical protein
MRRGQKLALALVLLLAVLGNHAVKPPPSPPPDVRGAGARTPEEPGLRAHADDITDYTLRASLDPAQHTVHGEGTIQFRNTSTAAVREVWVHLYLNAFKNERSAFLREPVGGFRGTQPIADWGTIDVKSFTVTDGGGTIDLWPRAEVKHKTAGAPPGAATEDDDDETDARVPLPHDVAPGESIAFSVVWDDKLPSIVERTGYHGSFHMVGQWFPKLARLEPNGTWAHFPFHHLAEFYADFGTYDVTLDVPKGFIIGATGPLIDSQTKDGRLIERHMQADIHDFAWTAWDKFQRKSETIDGVAVTVLYPKGFDRDANRELAAMRFALPYFGARYGRYPYPVLTMVHPEEAAVEAGGMEYPTLITTGGAWYGPSFVNLIEQVTIHEFGHQYFYGLVATDEVNWPFLDEGVNSYAEVDSLRALFGPGSGGELMGLSVADDSIQAVFGNLAEHDEPVAQPAYSFATGSRYAELVYSRTATILETFKRVYGAPAMQRAMGGYTRRYRFAHPAPEEFVAAFSEAMGENAAATLSRALLEKGWVDYAVEEVVSRDSKGPRGIFDKGGKRETVKDAPLPAGSFEGWVLVRRHGTLSFPVEVELALADGSRTRVAWDGQGDVMRIPYQGKTALRAAVVDPDHKVLLDDDLTNNHASAADAPTARGGRVLERALYVAEMLVHWVAP